jgi:cysteine--tRNA ligase
MKIYNTLTKKQEEFIPHQENIVNLYTCGPTVYSYAHIGNLRTYIFEDILEKSLKFLGYDVRRVMNITDIGHLENDSDTGEDKMQRAALKEHKKVSEIADFYTNKFVEDCESLNIKIPKIFEKASDNIPFTIKMIEKIIENGYGYVSNNNVYFDVKKFSSYYELPGNRNNQQVGVRETVDYDSNKKNQEDFALWFTDSKFKNQEMKWDSPWGYGYPGWHIECSGLAIKNLGEYLDIHCGGVDNIFPHHTNEIAQSEAYLGHKWCNYFMHGEHLNLKNAKMSKSLGNVITVDTLKEDNIDPLAYRLTCLQSHYRSQLVLDLKEIKKNVNLLNRLRNKIKKLEDKEDVSENVIKEYLDQFKDAINNDLNTSLMLKTMYDVLKSNISDSNKIYLLKEFDKVLSLDLFKEKEIDKELVKYIEEKIEERNKAKIEKNYQLADEIREELKEKNIILKDTKEKTLYEIVR